MSLENKNEEDLPTDVSEEQVEMAQQVTPVLPLYSFILVVCLIGVFISQVFTDGIDSIMFGGRLSTSLAGFDKPLFNEGQYWRILTGATLHGGLSHLLFNCYALYTLGKLIEFLSNRAHLANVFLLSALGGGILSLIFLPDGTSVGASGGVIGFLGYMTIYGFKRRKLLPEGFLKNMLINIGFIGFIGIFVLPNIDNFGHLGGLLVGIIYGFFQIPGDLTKDPRQIGATADFFGIISMGVFVFTAILSILLILEKVKF